MELKISSPNPGNLSPSDCSSDPEEKEVSDDDDDDRNHKHRRRGAHSQSSETDTRPYRKRNRAWENESQASETWKNFNRDFSGRFDKRRFGIASGPRGPMDFNQRTWVNQPFIGDPGSSRGRGRDSSNWNQRDIRFNSVDLASRIVQRGSIPPLIFAGRGLPNVSSGQAAPWSGFGLIPGLPNGGLDSLHSIGFQGAFRQPIDSSLNMGIPRQRCRDFEERGFCLRGDMCPMEHGVNRIVIEDVQSLSQFNLPGSLPSAPILGTANAGPGSLPIVGASSAIFTNNKGLQGKSSKSGVADDSLNLNGVYSGSVAASGSELYDPDQPLWNNGLPETSNALLAPLKSTKIDDTETLMIDDPSDSHQGRIYDGVDNEFPGRSAAPVAGSQSAGFSVWGRIGGSKNRSDVRDQIDPTVSSSGYLESEIRDDSEVIASMLGNTRQGKQVAVGNDGKNEMDSPLKTHSDAKNIIRRPSQKALRTIFVNGIPQKNNKKDALLSHFKKFGQVIDIYIPANSDRAFIQFSKMEEAEAALTSPEALMGNRFIKLWWANRDRIPDNYSSSSTQATHHGMTATSAPPPLSTPNKGKDNPQSANAKYSTVSDSDASEPASDKLSNGPKIPPPILQKKMESLEQLKDELRKKQEMLDQKRNEFWRKLDKLEKQATGTKPETTDEQIDKKPQGETAADIAKAATPKSTETNPIKNNSMENTVSQIPKLNASGMSQESSPSLKHPVRPLPPLGLPFSINRYKLDNRPTGFRILPPLPAGFANVAVIKEHFSSYGDISSVELKDLEEAISEQDASSKRIGHITFLTHPSAQRAFTNGKSWQGHNLKFTWVPTIPANDPGSRENILPTIPANDPGSRENILPTPKVPSNAEKEVSRNGENLPPSKVEIESKEAAEDLHQNSSQNSSEKDSMKGGTHEEEREHCERIVQ